MSFYGPAQRALQDRFDTAKLAAGFEATIITDSLDDEQRRFVESRDFFFLTTVDDDGWPTVSYKGGPPGLVRVLDERTLVFPSYDGNGMFLSMGNIEAAARIGMLFIDMEVPQRLRVQATAELDDDAELLASFPGAQLVVRATIRAAFPNCARYVHVHERVGTSRYVPAPDGSQPTPAWKRIDAIQPLLPEDQQDLVADAGGTITAEEYGARLADGTS